MIRLTPATPHPKLAQQGLHCTGLRGLSFTVTRSALVLAAVGPMSAALAQEDFPNRPIRIVVANAAGQGNDMIARLLAPGLSERWGRRVIVENRPGAGTIIGSESQPRAWRSPPARQTNSPPTSRPRSPNGQAS